ncbi:MAG: DNA-protecting protein DprA [Chloroflexi bacterium]|nr:MAG: DNA-protecting protein DprA [Chloroflexota bacterium]
MSSESQPHSIETAHHTTVDDTSLDYSDPDLPFWLALNRVTGIGPVRFRSLLDVFGSAQAAWDGDPVDWLGAGLDGRTVAGFAEQRRHIVPHTLVEQLIQLRVHAVRVVDPAYPRLLTEITSPPPVLYVRGRLLPRDNLAVAIVGTRRATTYGRQVTDQISRQLAEQGIAIVSGLARGIDTCAHSAALSGGGRTIAVLGCGPDIVYPPENARLLERIIENGAAVTPFAPGTPPEAANFPARNRLISGMSLGVVVTEAPRQSGALITAGFAGEQGRDVFAVPGSIYNTSSLGALRLIQDGAKLVMRVEDILSELNLQMLPGAAPTVEPENETEAKLLEVLGSSGEALHVDELSHRLGSPVAAISATLTVLELRRLVKLVGPMTYISCVPLQEG